MSSDGSGAAIGPMPRTVFVNGDFVPLADARVSVMDRGFLFADGIYEVSAVLDGGLVDNASHLARLARSLGAIGIADPFTATQWAAHQTELISRNGLDEGLVYIQVTRGAAERDFPFPAAVGPTVVMFTQAKRIIGAQAAETGVAAITVPDIRWARRDIKSIALLAQVLAKQKAAAAGAGEAILVDDGRVTEGASSTIYMVTKADMIVTRPLSQAILPGVTRQALLRLSAEHGLPLEERVFWIDECLDAAEVFMTSATSFVTPIVSIDGTPIGKGKPGPWAKRLRALYIDAARRSVTPLGVGS